MPIPKEKRSRIARTDEWQTIKQRSLWPEQVIYAMIRPAVLFSETAAERAKETGEARRSLYRKVEQFEEQGMMSPFKPTQKQAEDTYRSLLTAIRQVIADLKTAFPFCTSETLPPSATFGAGDIHRITRSRRFWLRLRPPHVPIGAIFFGHRSMILPNAA